MTSGRWSAAWNYAGESGEVSGLEASWSESLSLTPGLGGFRQASVSFVVPLDVGALCVRYPVARGFASLSYAGREVIAGRWRDVSYEPTSDGRTLLTLAIVQSDDDDRGAFPPLTQYQPQRDPNEIVDYGQLRPATAWEIATRASDDGLVWATDPNARYDTPGRDPDTLVRDPILRSDLWPNIAAPAEGASWAHPIGRPGRGTTLAAVPAYMVDETGDPKILIAGTWIAAPAVSIFGPTTAGGANLTRDDNVPVHHDTDPNGFVYAYVLASDLTLVNTDPQNTFYWSSPDADTTPAGAGDVLLSIIAACTLPVNVREFQRVAARLNAYLIDGYLDTPARPIDVLRDQLLPLLPLSIVPTAKGLTPILLPFLDDREARGLSVQDGIGIVSEGPVTFEDFGGASAVAVRYAYRADRQRAAFVARASAASTVYGRYVAAGAYDDTEARLVWDPGTAAVMAADAVRSASWIPRVVSLAVSDLDRFGPGGDYPLTPGVRVVFTSSRLGLDAVPAVVGATEYDAVRALVRLWLLDDPLTS